MKKFAKRFTSIILAVTLFSATSSVAYATPEQQTNATEETQSIDNLDEDTLKINWWTVGWKVLRDIVEKMFYVDGESEKDSSWVYMVSPTVEFNTGTMGNEVYYRPEIDNTVGSIRMHGHRTIAVDIFAKINLILSDARNNTVKSDATATNQYMFYTKKSADPNGVWKAQFVSGDKFSWQCYYAHYYNAGTRESVPQAVNGFFYGDNNRVFQYSENTSLKSQAVMNESFDMTALNAQFIDSTTGKIVDYLKNFEPGDEINFSDSIVDISFDEAENATTFYFEEDNSGKPIGWKFANDLTTEYSVGETLNLNFQVVKTGAFNDIQFESIDYFEEAFSHKSGSSYPDISRYK